MKTHLSKVVVSMILLSISQSVATGLVLTTFDTDLEEWRSNTPHEISWASEGGNPGGYLRFNDGSGNESSYVLVPKDYLGDWSEYEGEMISFDHKVFDKGNNVINNTVYRIEMSGPNGTAVWEGDEVTGATDWITVEIPLAETFWKITEGNWSLILTDVTDFKIGIEMFNNKFGLGEICGIDNVVLVPEPCTLLLLGLGGLCVLIKR